MIVATLRDKSFPIKDKDFEFMLEYFHSVEIDKITKKHLTPRRKLFNLKRGDTL
ncbi:hypothetical protein KAR91_57910 [Candidatus Pacearchaeota archaeon]|nr:hypothetical protein [Candidatus Pacearchaeota archaeon]